MFTRKILLWAATGGPKINQQERLKTDELDEATRQRRAERVHADRAAGGDCHYRHFGGAAAARAGPGKAKGPADYVSAI